jgi:hypothetical protein
MDKRAAFDAGKAPPVGANADVEEVEGAGEAKDDPEAAAPSLAFSGGAGRATDDAVVAARGSDSLLMAAPADARDDRDGAPWPLQLTGADGE